MDKPFKYRTLADLDDHTAKPRAQLPQTIAHGEQLKEGIAKVKREQAEAQSALAAAEALTAGLESQMRGADEKHRLITAAEYGAHVAKLNDVRARSAAVNADTAAKLPALEEELAANHRYIDAIQKAIKVAVARNAVALYEARLNDANLIHLARYVRDKMFDAGTFCRGNQDCELLLDPDADTKVGPHELRVNGRDERFDDFYKPKPPEPEKPVDESKFNGMWREIGKC